ncbi:MAG TPA: indole-3-glycerol phosphate synthase TrpC [Solirubrobacteraceae bacterium]|nr:indole-3-glycerol phosphate synthase TrpC [Solirubrobacteraceae bacterium]
MSGQKSDVLERILRSTREALQRRKADVPQPVLERRLAQATVAGAGVTASAPAATQSLHAALTQPGIAVIAEFKRRSPSAGILRDGAKVDEIVRAYERGGASALSVLTEESSFGGSLEDLRVARQLCELPVLRKDFIVDEYQLIEARTAGADAVLLIVAALEAVTLARLHDAAQGLGLEVLVEVHDHDELERALGVGARLIGVNNRDLRDFSVDIGRTTLLRGAIPDGIAVVSESGIAEAGQLRSLEQEGVDAVLVGESLMRAGDPQRALRELLGEAASSTPGGVADEQNIESETAKLRPARF